MHVWNGFEGIARRNERFVATIGNYDGVHRGHRTIIDRVTTTARAKNLPSLLITFEPHPLTVVAPERAPRLLQTRRQKIDALEAAGLDHVLLVPFNAEVAELSPEGFFRDWLARHVSLAALFVGDNFRFGKARKGDLACLERLGQQMNMEIHGISAVSVDGIVVSSTEVRRRVAEGDPETAQLLLGRPYELTGTVVRGDGRGRQLDFPTANVDHENDILPRPGVYVTETSVNALRLPSVTNVGSRPTFDGGTVRVETHVFEFDDDIYGERIDVRFLARLRDEQRFDSPDELADQIARDRAAAESYFANPRFQTT